MPSQLHRQTGPYGASPDTASHQVGWAVKGLAVLSCVGSHGPVDDTLLTTDRMQNAGHAHGRRARGSSSSRSTAQAGPVAQHAFVASFRSWCFALQASAAAQAACTARIPSRLGTTAELANRPRRRARQRPTGVTAWTPEAAAVGWSASTISLPSGNSAILAILKQAIPKGMPMTVRQRTMPMTIWAKASQHPSLGSN
jgi:hypothetical protein